MSPDEDRRALERYVAGLPVADDAIAHALTARAVERTVVVTALLKGLDAPDAGVRRRIAQRVGRMSELDPQVKARLAVLVAHDGDERVRTAGAEALAAHGAAVPGADPPPRDQTTSPHDAPYRAWLGLRAFRVRTAERPISIEAGFADDAPKLTGDLHDDGTGGTRIELRGLPSAFIGTSPTLRVASEPGPLVVIARAEEPVSPDRTVTFRVPAATSREDLEVWCLAGLDLAVLDDS